MGLLIAHGGNHIVQIDAMNKKDFSSEAQTMGCDGETYLCHSRCFGGWDWKNINWPVAEARLKAHLREMPKAV